MKNLSLFYMHEYLAAAKELLCSKMAYDAYRLKKTMKRNIVTGKDLIDIIEAVRPFSAHAKINY